MARPPGRPAGDRIAFSRATGPCSAPGPSRVAVDIANADGGLADEIDAARAEAVKGLRAYGYSWAEIGSRLGITRQAAQQRWGQRREPGRATHDSDRRQVTASAAPCSAWTCGFRCALAGQAGAPRRNTPDRSGGDMAQTKARTSVKDKALYKRLRNLGVSVKESTRVANASAKTSRQKAGQRGGAATSFANWKVPELRRRAKKAGIKGRSTMNKKQLIKALRSA
jgi:hypothetical protein